MSCQHGQVQIDIMECQTRGEKTGWKPQVINPNRIFLYWYEYV